MTIENAAKPPVNPGGPIDPGKPTDPNEPIDPDKPTDPEKPTAPERPTGPDNHPNGPDDPGDSGQSGNGGTGNADGDPSIPQTGDNTWLLIAGTALTGALLAAMTIYRGLRAKRREKE